MPRLWALIASTFAAVAALPPSDCGEARPEPYEPRSFLGYGCEDHCQRHKAGFAWAERQRVTEPARCEELEPHGAEGCRAYAEESLPAEEAGYRWALENEVNASCLCDGAGEGFRAGCIRFVAEPTGKPSVAAPKRGRGAPSRFNRPGPAGKLRR